MDKYKVKLNLRAICELDSNFEYIIKEKLAPEKFDHLVLGECVVFSYKMCYYER